MGKYKHSKSENSLFNLGLYGHARWWQIHKHVGRIVRMIKAIYMRAKYGFSYADIWNLDWFLGNLMHDAFIFLSKGGVSYPTSYKKHEFWAENLCKNGSFMEGSSSGRR